MKCGDEVKGSGGACPGSFRLDRLVICALKSKYQLSGLP